ncbi:ATP-binding cassette domain-containing protein [Candidatus Woesearchaeota archaeon]|nr:ATP-binding cassette domain-containing protein [Candidatus Woesearchaeota archaeon]
MKTLLQLQNVHKTYHVGEVDVHALRGVDLEVKDGEFLAILGKSGSGKSTLLNSVGCLDKPTKGRILLDGKDIENLEESDLAQVRGKKIGFIFQNFNLIPSLSALENVMLPMIFQGTEEGERKTRAIELLNLVGLGDRMDHTPGQLSVDGDEYIMIKENGEIKVKKIKAVVDGLLKNSKDVEKIKGVKEGLRVGVKGIKVVTFNDEYKQEFTDMKYAVRHKTDELLEIKTEYGYKIKATHSHSIFVYKNGKIYSKRVEELTEGDVLPVSLSLPSESNFDNREINLYDELKNDANIVLEKNKIRFKGSRAKIDCKVKVNSKFCRILGDFVSEGCVRFDEENKRYYLTFTFNMNEKKRVERLKDDFKEIFGLNLRIKTEEHKNTTTLIVENKIISYIFKNYFKLGDKSWKRDFPDFIFNLSDNLKLDFLAGVYGDGTHRHKSYNRKRREISIKTTSNILANKLHFLLLQLGYIASYEENMPKQRARRKTYRLVTYSKQCLKLADELIKRDYSLNFLDMSNLGSDELTLNYLPMDGNMINAIDLNRNLFSTREFPGIGGVLRRDNVRVGKIRKDLLSYMLNKFQLLDDYKKITEGDVGFVKIKSVTPLRGERYVYDVTDKTNRFIGTFGFYLHNSGGQQQRVAIARALSNDPKIILADEPTGNLDSKTEEDIIDMLTKLHRKERKTIIMITHNQKLARYAQRIIHLTDGRIEK